MLKENVYDEYEESIKLLVVTFDNQLGFQKLLKTYINKPSV